jgi:hypothetical protein
MRLAKITLETPMNQLKVCFAAMLISTFGVAHAATDSVQAWIAEYDKTYQMHDVAKMEQILAADYQVVVNGKSIDRDGALAEYRAHKPTATSLSSNVTRVIDAGDYAIATGVITIETSKGKTER